LCLNRASLRNTERGTDRQRRERESEKKKEFIRDETPSALNLSRISSQLRLLPRAAGRDLHHTDSLSPKRERARAREGEGERERGREGERERGRAGERERGREGERERG
jgi:hypothetical protein